MPETKYVLLCRPATVSNTRTQLAWQHKADTEIPNSFLMKYIMFNKLYLKQQCWARFGLRALTWALCSNTLVSSVCLPHFNLCSSQPYSQVPGIMFLMRTLFHHILQFGKMYRSPLHLLHVINQTLGRFPIEHMSVLRGCVISF